MCEVTDRIEHEPRLMAKLLDMTVRLQRVGKTLDALVKAAKNGGKPKEGDDGTAKPVRYA